MIEEAQKGLAIAEGELDSARTALSERSKSAALAIEEARELVRAARSTVTDLMRLVQTEGAGS
jgi:hypothetical protein